MAVRISAHASPLGSVHPISMDKHPRNDRDEWLDARIRFRNAAKEIMVVRRLYPEGSQPTRDVEERLYRFYTEHADAAYELLRRTECIIGMEDPAEMARTLPEDLCIDDEGSVDISLLAFAIERNESMLKAVHQAVEVLLLYVKHEQTMLQALHRDQHFKE
ncbi:hypothetical protein LXA43DRAFT_1064039 [Ganoderma leucocontextum]|nr:hypothetical protein LXA43DRAFT_1064039 [Ganoderma leucocontextum]